VFGHLGFRLPTPLAHSEKIAVTVPDFDVAEIVQGVNLLWTWMIVPLVPRRRRRSIYEAQDW